MAQQAAFLHLARYRHDLYHCATCNYCVSAVWPQRGIDGVCATLRSHSPAASYSGKGYLATARALLEGETLALDSLAERAYACTTCGNCESVCPIGMPPTAVVGALRAELEPFGQTIGIVPSSGAAATVGGAVSAHALGTGSPHFQSMGDQVAGLEVALADGSFIRTGSAAAHGAGFFQRYAIGPDLTGLFIGADGTLGVITKIALWLQPLPAHRETACLGFADYPSAAAFMGELQRKALLDKVWYGAGYDAASVRGRLLGADPAFDPASLPRFVLGLDYSGDADAISRDRARIETLASHHGGRPQPHFDEVYFHDLRSDELYWYSYAGYFATSRCAMVMASFATETLPAFPDQAQAWREQHPQFTWASATVLCRRGLHGAVLTFYDEQHQWPDVQEVVAGCTGGTDGDRLRAVQERQAVGRSGQQAHRIPPHAQAHQGGARPRRRAGPGQSGAGRPAKH